MLNTAKSSPQNNAENELSERRNHADRRVSENETRFPFIDENCKLVMKDRRNRNSDRRSSDIKARNNPFKVVSKLFRK